MMVRKRTKKEFVEYNDYHDRPFGLKWGTAFALDELTQSIEKNKKIANKKVEALPQMARQEIDAVLQYAFLKSKKVSIQLNTRDDFGNLMDSIVGSFTGFADETYLTIDNHEIEWDMIRNIKTDF